jgi:RNA polymerase sigma factor (sigma-70 family)
MASESLAPVLRYIRKISGPGLASATLTDGELLARFAVDRDQGAFAILVQRHGPMVFRVLLRILQNQHAAEDAFQAVFLVLVRKAGSLQQPEGLAPWLYGTAYRTALKARAETLRRHMHEERAAAERTAIHRAEDVDWLDVRPVLDEEIDRLPARYRAPVVLCYIRGLTNAEAARILGCSRGTVATRLTRAREKLRRRLVRRGMVVTASGLVTALSQNGGSAAVPAALFDATLAAVQLSGAGNSVTLAGFSETVVTFMKGVLRTMFLNKVKTASALLLSAGILALGIGVLPHSGGPARAADEEDGATQALPRPLDKPRLLPKATEPVLSYAVGLTVLEERNGQKEALAKPTLVVPDGKVGSFSEGGETVVSLGDRAESMPFGLICSVVVAQFNDKDDRATLKLTVEHTPRVRQLPGDEGALANGVSVHALRRVRIGDPVRVQVNPPGEDRKLTVTATIQEVQKTVTILHRRAGATKELKR